MIKIYGSGWSKSMDLDNQNPSISKSMDLDDPHPWIWMIKIETKSIDLDYQNP